MQEHCFSKNIYIHGKKGRDEKVMKIPTYYYAGRDWGQEEKGTAEDETAGWHH